MAHDPTPLPGGLVDLCGFDIDRLAALSGPVSGEWLRQVAAWIGYPAAPLPPALAAAFSGSLTTAGYQPRSRLYGEVSDGEVRRGREVAELARPGEAAALPADPSPAAARPRLPHDPAPLTAAGAWAGFAGSRAGPPAPSARHRVTHGDVDAVARGRAGPAVLTELRRAQISRRMLLLWAVLRSVRAADVDAETQACLATAVRALARAQRRAPGEVHALLLHPTVGIWLVDSLRRCWRAAARVDGARVDGARVDGVGAADVDGLGYLGGIAIAAALRARQPCRVPVRIVDGLIAVPTVGCAVVGAAGGWALAVVTPAGAGGDRPSALRVMLPDRCIVVRPDDPHPPTGGAWLPARSASAAAGTAAAATAAAGGLELSLEDTDPFRGSDALPLPVAARGGPATAARWRRLTGAAGAILASTDASQAAEVAGTLRALVPLRDAPDQPSSSATVTDALGTIMITPPLDAMRLAIALVHEAAHSRLEMLGDITPLVRAVEGPRVHFAPWRPDPRPLVAVLHGAFAYSRMAAFWAARWARPPGADDLQAAYELAWCRGALRLALPALRAAGGLTEAGDHVVAAMEADCDGWDRVELPAALTRAARRVLRDVGVVWRLRNIRPDAEHIAGWAWDWLAGRPCGRPAPPRSRVEPWTTPHPVHRHARQRLTALAFASPRCGGLHLPGAATAGDRAAVAGDTARAAVEFRRELRERPGRVESFAGLALIHAARVGGGLERRLCLDHPEALLALGERIRAATGRTPDLPDLTAWIAAARPTGPTRPVRRMVTRAQRTPAASTC
ncbi:aKG-HExxH-type peptide beta-hydroxylase [Frankia sp. ACN1ag]|uniref:aKG-HExxH-type peptide beta-hydroxylase n=1 Tax=Frankia sp. ACN1ag TaxID=102891 RepID=UPI0006DC4D5E|nr:HEXXH motif-containing putative peptide modification protein [Frankia sp. ACN1ag]KQC35100.1 hypothetical protein UK82_28340 [Frankia sp. ACN1ag]